MATVRMWRIGHNKQEQRQWRLLLSPNIVAPRGDGMVENASLGRPSTLNPSAQRLGPQTHLDGDTFVFSSISPSLPLASLFHTDKPFPRRHIQLQIPHLSSKTGFWTEPKPRNPEKPLTFNLQPSTFENLHS